MPDPSFILPLILQSALVPFGVALLALFVLRALRVTHAAAIALGLGFTAAYFATFHRQWSPVPQQALDWLPWIAAAAVAGAIAVERIAQTVPRIAARTVLALAIAAIVIWPAAASLGMPKTLLSIAVTGVLAALAWSVLARDADRPASPLLPAMVAGGTALALMLDASQSIGQSSGALASALIACFVCRLLPTRVAFGAAATGSAVLLLGALLANAHFYAGFSLAYVALLALALLADPLVAAIGRLRNKTAGAGAAFAVLALGAVPVAIVLAQAVKTAQESGGY